MGADVYLESVSNAARAQYKPLFNKAIARRNRAKTKKTEDAAQAEVNRCWDMMYPADGYYRDAYNPSCFLAVINLSWWRDVIPMLDEGYLPIEKAKELLAMIEVVPVTLERVTAHLAVLNKEGNRIENDPPGWLERWQKDQRDLCALLRKSIEVGEPLYCSL
jgi:hypothetical protein